MAEPLPRVRQRSRAPSGSLVEHNEPWLGRSGARRVSRLRHADELVGILVLLAIFVLIAAILEAGFLGRWFQPTTSLRILLPTSGVGGLVGGADVEVLGTHVGRVRRVVINRQRIYADTEIDDQVRDIITRDSVAVIRRRFGIAGAAFVDIQRGSGPAMDWRFAVIEGSTERSPTDSVSTLIDNAREKIFPILADLGRATHSLAEIVVRVERGEGNIGRVLADDALMHEAEATLAAADAGMSALRHLLGTFDEAGVSARGLVDELRDGRSGLPPVLRQSGELLTDLHRMTSDLRTRAPAIARNINESAENLPALLQQTEMTAQQLEKLLVQLRGHWLLGGGGGQQESLRLAPAQARP